MKLNQQQNQTISSPDIDKMTQLLKQMDFPSISAQINQAATKNASVLLLVGNTGSGKSTIFNFLNDAEFQIQQKGINKELILKSTDRKFQKIKGGLESVTTIPKCQYNAQHNHLVIDFPGFGDTNGWVNQFIIKLMLNKILKLAKLKIVFITAQPSGQFEERGSSLFKELKSLLQCGITQQDEIGLIINQYCDEYSIEEVVQYVLDQLQELQQNAETPYEKLIINAASKKVTLIQLIDTDQKIIQLMSQNAKENLWSKLISIKPIQIKQFRLEHQDRIQSFFQDALGQYLHQVQNFFGQFFNKIDQLSISNLQKLQQELSKLQHTKIGSQSRFIICQNACQILVSIVQLAVKTPSIDERFQLIYELVKNEESFMFQFQNNEEDQKQMIQSLSQQIAVQINCKEQQKQFQEEQETLRNKDKKEFEQAQEKLQKQFEQNQQALSRITDQEEYSKKLEQCISEYSTSSLKLQEQHNENMQKMNEAQLKKLKMLEEQARQKQSGGGFFEFLKVCIIGVVLLVAI